MPIDPSLLGASESILMHTIRTYQSLCLSTQMSILNHTIRFTVVLTMSVCGTVAGSSEWTAMPMSVTAIPMSVTADLPLTSQVDTHTDMSVIYAYGGGYRLKG